MHGIGAVASRAAALPRVEPWRGYPSRRRRGRAGISVIAEAGREKPEIRFRFVCLVSRVEPGPVVPDRPVGRRSDSGPWGWAAERGRAVGRRAGGYAGAVAAR